QTLLNPASHPIVRSIALADLSAAGTDTMQYLRDGPDLFAEDEMDIAHALQRARKVSDIDAATQDLYRDRFLHWLQAQAMFATGRKELFEEEHGAIPEACKRRLRDIFNAFDTSITAAGRVANEATHEPFGQLMRRIYSRAFPEG